MDEHEAELHEAASLIEETSGAQVQPTNPEHSLEFLKDRLHHLQTQRDSMGLITPSLACPRAVLEAELQKLGDEIRDLQQRIADFQHRHTGRN